MFSVGTSRVRRRVFGHFSVVDPRPLERETKPSCRASKRADVWNQAGVQAGPIETKGLCFHSVAFTTLFLCHVYELGICAGVEKDKKYEK